MAGIKDRISKLEGQVQADPVLRSSQWWHELEAMSGEYEAGKAAAYFLALEEVIARPPDPMWKRMEARFDADFSKWSRPMQLFGNIYEQIEHEYFDGKEEQDDLLNAGIIYWCISKDAPLPDLPEISKNGAGRVAVVCKAQLRGEFLFPIFDRLFPEGHPNHNKRHLFEDWLEEMEMDESDDVPDSLVDSLYTFLETRK